MRITLVVVFVCLVITTKAEFSDLENFVRVLGSLDPTASTVSYINGSVYMKHASSKLRKIFNYEGYSINRKIRQDNETYMSLSREFLVYRDPVTSHILRVWMNPLSNETNEVFHVMNDPVSYAMKQPFQSSKWPENGTVYTVYNATMMFNFPNPLSPEKYPKFSSGPLYHAVEVFDIFVNQTQLIYSEDDSLPAIATWTRKSDFLPWMELGATPGSLYYNAFGFKCSDGLSCVAKDIKDLVSKEYPNFLAAPEVPEGEAVNSWTVFKQIVDTRRSSGLPDTNIPIVNATANPTTIKYTLDERIEKFIYYSFPISVKVTGTAWAEVPGKHAIPLYDIKGNIAMDFEPLTRQDGYRLQLDGTVQFFNYTTKDLLVYFNNPFTGTSNMVVKISGHCPVETHFLIDGDSMYTTDIASSGAVGLSGVSSVEKLPEGHPEHESPDRWSVNLFNFIFPYGELEKGDLNEGLFFGTFTIFRSWPKWLDMGDTPGNLMLTVTIGKERTERPDWSGE